MRSSGRRAGPQALRLGRLILGRNELRRPCDRIEGMVLASLLAAFAVACVAAASLATHFYRSGQAEAARLQPALAVLSQPGPVTSRQAATIRATWRLPDGAERSGTLTAATAPAIYDAPAGASVPVWLDRSGQPRLPPAGPGAMIFNALSAAVTTTAGAAVALVICYSVCRIALDRHRLARWEAAWAAVGPRWTSRR
jgi:hypothetical protein